MLLLGKIFVSVGIYAILFVLYIRVGVWLLEIKEDLLASMPEKGALLDKLLIKAIHFLLSLSNLLFWVGLGFLYTYWMFHV